MKRLISILAATLALALLASPANAGPIVTAIGFIFGGAGSLGALEIAGGFFGTILGRIALSVGLSALSRALAPKPKTHDPGIQTSVTQTGGTHPRSFVLGKYATAGTFVRPPMSHSGNRYLTYVIAYSVLPGTQLSRVSIDGTWITPSGTADPDYGTPIGGKFAGHAWVKWYDGTQTAVDPTLVAKFGAHPDYPVTASMVGYGVVYGIYTFLYDRNIFGSFPATKAELKNAPLYDPRADSTAGGTGAQRWTDTTTWAATDNPAVMIYNILRGLSVGSEIYGGEVAVADVPFSEWSTAMNICDTAIALAAGGTEPQYRAGFEIRVSDEPASAVEELLKSCSGAIAEIGGVWKMRAGAPALPVYSFTDDDLLISQAQSLAPYPSLRDTYNGVAITYPDAAGDWSTTEAPRLHDAAAETEDGRRLMADVSLPAVPYTVQVQRLGAAWLKDARRFIKHSTVLPPAALIVEPLDTVSWTSARNGYTTKTFEVASAVASGITMRQALSLREVDPTDYDWSSSQEHAVTFPAAVPETLSMIAPGVSTSSTLRVAREQVIGVLFVDITAGDLIAAAYDVEYQYIGDTTWTAIGHGQAGRYEVPGLPDGTINVRARGVAASRKTSDWTTLSGVVFAPFAAPPADVTGFNIVTIGGLAYLKWDASPALDLSHYILRFSPRTSGVTWSEAVETIPRVARPATSVQIPVSVGTYLIKAVDKSGNESVNATAVVTNIAVVTNMNVVETITEDPAFSGVGTNIAAKSPGIIISDISVPGSGTYEFAGTLDLGAVFTSRFTVGLTFTRWSASLPTWDTYPGTVDTWPLIDSIGVDFNISDVSVAVQVSTSDDLTTWSAWGNLIVGDYTTRAAKFRAVLTTQTAGASPWITALSVQVDMPDRIVAGADVISGAGAKTITFSPAFKASPALGIAAQDMATGDYYSITAKSASGFTIEFFDSSGTAISRTFDYQAKGYGQ